LSTSVFDSSRFRLIQNYQSQEASCAIQDDSEASERNKKIVQGLISKVLEEASGGISEERVEAYESFLSGVEMIDGEYSSLNYGNPFSDSIAQMQERLSTYKQEKKDTSFKSLVKAIQGFDFEKVYTSKNVEKMVPKLESFVNELIDDRLPSLSGSEQRKASEIANQIKKIGVHVESDVIGELAECLELAVLQASNVYRGLVSDQPISFDTKEAAQGAALKLNNLISKLSPLFPKIRRSTGQKLLERLYAADDAMIKVGILTKESPIATAIGLLETALKVPSRERPLPKKEAVVIDTPETKSSKVASLISRFQRASESTPSPIVRKPTPARILSPEEKRDRFLLKVQTQLESLHRMNGSEIYQLMTSLQENKALFSSSDQEGIDRLISALTKLRDTMAFRPSVEENMFRKHWAKLLSAYGITEDSYARTIKPVQRETKGALIRLIQENPGSFSELNRALEKALSHLETQAISQRFIGAEVKERQSKSFSSDIALNLANTIRHFEAFRHEAEDYLDNQWGRVVERSDKETNGKFSEVISHLGYCNLAKQRESICLRVTDQGMKQFMTGNLFEMAGAQSTETYGISLAKLKATEESFYMGEVTAKYRAIQPDLKWIKEHIDYIKVVYDQGSDLNRNMGTGTCERNSEDRVKLLLRSPHTPSEKISLGSTQVGRFNQAVRDQIFAIKDSHPKEALQKLQASYERVGLRLHHIYPVPVGDKQDPQEALCNELGRIVMNENETLFILGLSGKSSVGHAINIQVDLSKPIYRFMDDNIGTVECPDAEKFTETLSSWLRTAYPDLPKYDLSVFRPASV